LLINSASKYEMVLRHGGRTALKRTGDHKSPHPSGMVPYTVIGAMPPGTFDREWQDEGTPLAFKPEEMTRDDHWMISWARLKPGVTLEQATEQMEAIAARIEGPYPKSNEGGARQLTGTRTGRSMTPFAGREREVAIR
jgi:hypothetical protein